MSFTPWRIALSIHAPAGRGPKGLELVLESNSRAPARRAQKALHDAVFPAAILSTNDLASDYQRLKRLGVKFRGKPKKIPSCSYVFFDDTCGNFIVLRESETERTRPVA